MHLLMPTLPRSHSAFVPHGLTAPFRGATDGPLAGLTAAVKDMYDIVGTRTSGGNPDWLNTHPPASSSAAAVRKILDAGATVVGTTICDEFFYSVTGDNVHYGTPANPRAPCYRRNGARSGGPLWSLWYSAHARQNRLFRGHGDGAVLRCCRVVRER